MRILIINDFYVQGGAETQVKDEISVLNENNIETLLLTFDKKYKTGFLEENKYNYRCSKILFIKFFNKFFINVLAYNKILRIVERFQPDFIHIHNDLKMTKTIRFILKKLNKNIIKTFHDYSYVCPKGTSILDNGEECDGFNNHCCHDCSFGFAKKIIKKIELKRNFNWINKNVVYGLSPSVDLQKKLLLNKYNTNIMAFPNVFKGEKKLSKKTSRDFLYCGVVSKNKGIDLLIDLFSKQTHFSITIAGDVDISYKQDFFKMISPHSNIKYVGRVNSSMVKELYNNHFCLIVPSLWLENYPNVILESIFEGTICIGSNRGGIPEMLNNEELLFDPLSISSLEKSMNYVLSLSSKEYIQIVKEIQNRLFAYNSESNYYKLFKEMIND